MHGARRARIRRAISAIARTGREFIDGGGYDDDHRQPLMIEGHAIDETTDPTPDIQAMITGALSDGWPVDALSDGNSTFADLYTWRRILHAALIPYLLADGVTVVKSRRQADGEPCEGGEAFVVVTELDTGQVTHHYPIRHWRQIQCPVIDRAPEWDGHTAHDAVDRISALLYLRERAADILDVHVCVGRIGVPMPDGRGLADTGDINHCPLPAPIDGIEATVTRVYRTGDRIMAVVTSHDRDVIADLEDGRSSIGVVLRFDGPAVRYRGETVAMAWRIDGFRLSESPAW